MLRLKNTRENCIADEHIYCFSHMPIPNTYMFDSLCISLSVSVYTYIRKCDSAQIAHHDQGVYARDQPRLVYL